MEYFIAKKPSIHVTLVSHEGFLQGSSLSLSSDRPGFYLEWNDDNLSDNLLSTFKQWLNDYAQKKSASLSLPLDYSFFPPFTSAVLSHLLTLSFGNATTYGTIAEILNKKKGARAVGNACGANPFPLFIPCHRVLGKGHTLGGFSCGLEIKKELLHFENLKI